MPAHALKCVDFARCLHIGVRSWPTWCSCSHSICSFVTSSFPWQTISFRSAQANHQEMKSSALSTPAAGQGPPLCMLHMVLWMLLHLGILVAD